MTVLSSVAADRDDHQPRRRAGHEAIKQAVFAGLGIGLLSELAIQEEFKKKTLIAIPTMVRPLKRGTDLVWMRHRSLTSSLQAFIDVCQVVRGAKACH